MTRKIPKTKRSLYRKLFATLFFALLFVLNIADAGFAQQVKKPIRKKVLATDTLLNLFHSPPDSAKSRVYWFWIYNRVTKEGITRDLEQFKAKGISGVNLICN